MELRRREPDSPSKAITARAIAAAEAEAALSSKPASGSRDWHRSRQSGTPTPRTEDNSHSQRPKKDGRHPKTLLSDMVRSLEDKEKHQREKKRALAEENRKLKDEIEKVMKMREAEAKKNTKLQARNKSLLEARDKIFKELNETKDELKVERGRAEGLAHDLQEHIEKLKDRNREYAKLSKDFEEQNETNEDLAALAKHSEFESRLHRTALAAGFKLLPSLADQVTFRRLVVKTERFLRHKIAAQEAAHGALSKTEQGTATASNPTEGVDSIKAKQFKFLYDDDDDDDEDSKPPFPFDLDEDCKLLLACDFDDDTDQKSPFAIKLESTAKEDEPRADSSQRADSRSLKRKIDDAGVVNGGADSDCPLAKKSQPRQCKPSKLRKFSICDSDSDSDRPLAKQRKDTPVIDWSAGGDISQERLRKMVG